MKQQLLFIEDNLMTGEFLSGMFDWKYEVKWCQSGEEALCWLKDFNIPNLIVADFNLPGINGLEFLEEIKQMGFMKEIPVVMLSGNTAEGIKDQTIKAGAADYLIKPFKPKGLRLSLEKLLYKNKYFASQHLN